MNSQFEALDSTGQATKGRPATSLLQVRDLCVSFLQGPAEAQVIRKVNFDVGAGERVGIVGESGSGKTVTGLALMNLLPQRLSRVEGSIRLDGNELVGLPERALEKVRGRSIAMIFQEPMSALDPAFTVGYQISEAIRSHFSVSRREARARATDALARVGIPLPSRRFDEYPHQLSGGMRQRVMIAIALVCEPKLIIADEPTTALDVTVQAQIIDTLTTLSEQSGTALIFITHDIGVVAESCTRLLTMYAGEVIEDGKVDDILMRPRHPYTSGLMRSLTKLTPRKAELPSIPGRVPNAREMPEGCRFSPRCGYAAAGCDAYQVMQAAEARHLVRCRRYNELSLPGAVS